MNTLACILLLFVLPSCMLIAVGIVFWCIIKELSLWPYWLLVHIWNVICLRRGLIILVTALTVVLVALVTFLICPTYSSTAHIFIRNDW